MKPSERILSVCAVVLTVVAILAWLRFDSADRRATTTPPSVLVIHTNQIRRVKTGLPPLGLLQTDRMDPLHHDQSVSNVMVVTESTDSAGQRPTEQNPVIRDQSYGSGFTPFNEAATIIGSVRFVGTPPRPKLIKMDANPQCAALNPQGAYSEDVVVNTNGTLRNVFVYISSGLDQTSLTPPQAVEMEEESCRFAPHVLGMQTRQLLLISNHDDTFHNFHALPKINQEFNKPQPPGSPALKKTFIQPEVMIKVKDDVDPWMTAYIGVVDHSFFAVTGEGGRFGFVKLPKGDYTITAWHEVYGMQSQQVRIVEKETKQISFTFHGQ